MAVVGATLVLTAKDASTRVLNGIRANLSNVAGAALALSKTSVAVGAAATGAFLLAARAGARLESAVTSAWAKTGEGTEALQSIRNAAEEMGAVTKFTAEQAAQGMENFALAGFTAKESTEAIRGSLSLAAATAADLAQVTEVTATTLRQFSLESGEAGHLANVFTAAINGSNLSMTRIQEAMKEAGISASGFGLDVEETTALLAQLANKGIVAGSAGTVLTQAMLSLRKQTERGNKALAELGLTYDDVNPATRKFTDIVRTLAKRGATQTQIFDLMGDVGGRLGGVIDALSKDFAEGGDTLSEFIQNLRDSSEGIGEAEKNAQKLLGTVLGQYQLFGSAVSNIMVQVNKKTSDAQKELLKATTAWINEDLRPLLLGGEGLGGALLDAAGFFVDFAAAVNSTIQGVRAFVAAGSAISAKLRGNKEDLKDALAVLREYDRGADAASIALAALSGRIEQASIKVKNLTDTEREASRENEKLLDGVTRSTDAMQEFEESISGANEELGEMIDFVEMFDRQTADFESLRARTEAQLRLNQTLRDRKRFLDEAAVSASKAGEALQENLKDVELEVTAKVEVETKQATKIQAELGEVAKGFLQSIGQSFLGIAKEIVQQLGTSRQEFGDFLEEKIGAGAQRWIDNVVRNIPYLFEKLAEEIPNLATKLGASVARVIENVAMGLPRIVTQLLLEGASKFAGALTKRAPDIAFGIVSGMVNLMSDKEFWLDMVSAIGQAIFDGTIGMFRRILKVIDRVFGTELEGRVFTGEGRLGSDRQAQGAVASARETQAEAAAQNQENTKALQENTKTQQQLRIEREKAARWRASMETEHPSPMAMKRGGWIHAANGLRVPGAESRPVPIMAHGNERVLSVPEQQRMGGPAAVDAAAAGRGAGGASVVVNLQVNAGQGSIDQALADTIRQNREPLASELRAFILRALPVGSAA